MFQYEVVSKKETHSKNFFEHLAFKLFTFIEFLEHPAVRIFLITIQLHIRALQFP